MRPAAMWVECSASCTSADGAAVALAAQVETFGPGWKLDRWEGVSAHPEVRSGSGCIVGWRAEGRALLIAEPEGA